MRKVLQLCRPYSTGHAFPHAAAGSFRFLPFGTGLASSTIFRISSCLASSKRYRSTSSRVVSG